jgi:cysteinyl-tRNA synthetase
LQTTIKNQNISDEQKIALINKMDEVLSLSLLEEGKKVLDEQANSSVQNSESNPEIEKLIAERAEAKKQKNYARSDEIRDELKAKGIILIDTPQGTTWKYE